MLYINYYVENKCITKIKILEKRKKVLKFTKFIMLQIYYMYMKLIAPLFT